MTRVHRIQGTALPLPGANIDTDRIIPARFLRTVSFDGLEQHVFADDRREAAAAGTVHPFDDPRFATATVLLVNENFGCGSSREHAPQALYRRGIRAVVGESFSEIFFGNALMLGMPCVTAAHADVARLMRAVSEDPALELRLDLETNAVDAGAVHAAVTMPPNARDAFLTGVWDATGLLLDRYDEVDATAGRLPYVTGAWR